MRPRRWVRRGKTPGKVCAARYSLLAHLCWRGPTARAAELDLAFNRVRKKPRGPIGDNDVISLQVSCGVVERYVPGAGRSTSSVAAVATPLLPHRLTGLRVCLPRDYLTVG